MSIPASSSWENTSTDGLRPPPPVPEGSSKRLPFYEYSTDLTILTIWGVLLHFVGLGALEFIRHTEADRTLIAWEMLERGNYLVPHLLGSPILTKPPFFYWVLAGAINLFGSAEEWVVRLPSATIAIVFTFLQYFFLRKISFSRKSALLGAMCLGSGAIFLALSQVAEIDMAYGFLSTLVFYASYLSLLRPALWKTVGCYLLLALAFLAKGPPVVAFFVVGLFSFWLWHLQRERKFTGEPIKWLAAFQRNVWGTLSFSLIVGIWLYALGSQFGWAELWYQVDTEIIHRVVAPSRHERGFFFYLGTIGVGLLPWSVFLFTGLFVILFQKSTARKYFENYRHIYRFFIFNALVVVFGIFLLSLASGKSNRYFFPLYACAINLSLVSMLVLAGKSSERFLFRLGTVFGVLIVLALFIVPFFVSIPLTVFDEKVFFVAMICVLSAGALVFSCFKKEGPSAIFSLFLLIFGLRLGETFVYDVYRNQERSVKAIASSLQEIVPAKVPLYTVEMFERWVIYYYKRLDREAIRLTPVNSKDPQSTNGRIYLLLSVSDEFWRAEQLYYYDRSLKLLREFKAGKDEFLLLEADASKVRYLAPKKRIPTVPSPAYYADGSDWISQP